ncbi:MAG: Txe/YoeB family addiction module toxin [Verrucomicrobiota bacterium]
MELVWLEDAWDDDLYWQKTDKKVLKRLNQLIKETLLDPFDGIGKPEPLKANLTGWWSRRITGGHRLVYRIEDSHLIIFQCRFHY